MPPFIQHENRFVLVHQYPVASNRQEETSLTAAAAAASGTITVKSITNFSTNQVLLLGKWGADDSEIVKTHASTTPSGTTITLAANTTYAHPIGTPVYRLEFDQVEISHAATATGSKSVLTTTNLQPDKHILRYLDTSQTSGFYFARFKDSINSTFGNYTDALQYGGWATSTVAHAIWYALRNNRTNFSDNITVEWFIDEVNSCLKNISGKLKRWPEHKKDNQILNQTLRGTHIYSMPSDIADNDSNKSINSIRIGDGQPLQFLDPIRFEAKLADAKWTQVRTAASAGDTSLNVDNSYDFADSGTLVAFVSGTKDSFTYTGVTRDDASGATAAFTGIPSSGDDAIGNTLAADVYIWQDEEEGKPAYYTTRGGNIEIWPLPDGNYDNMNIYIDYWAAVIEVNTLGDTLDTDRKDMVKFWLDWAVHGMDEKDGKRDFGHPGFVLYKEALNDAIRTSRSADTFPMKPKVNRISM